MEKSVVEIEIKGGDSVGSLKKQLREAQKEVETLSQKFGATSEEAVNAARKAAQLKDAIGDAKALTDAYNPDAKFKGFAQALQGVVGAFTAVQGAMGLLGVENENVEKTLLRVQSAMALTQGLNTILESQDAFKNLSRQIGLTSAATKIYNFVMFGTATATKAADVATKATAVSMRILRGIMATLGIGALIAGVTILISKISSWIGSTDSAKEANERLNRAIDEQNKLFAKNRQRVQEAREDAIAEAKIKGASADQLFKINQDFNKKDLAETEKNLNDKRKLLQDYEKKSVEIVIKDGKRIAQGSEENIEQYKKLQQELENADKEASSARRKIVTDEQQENIRVADENRANAQKAAGERKQAADKAAQDAKSKSEKAKQEREQEAKQVEEDRKEAAKRITELEDEIFLQSLKDDFQRSLAKLSQDKEKQINEINATKANTEQKQKEIALVEQKFAQDKAKIEEEEKKKREEKEKEDSEKAAAKLKERLDLENSIRIAAIKDEFERKKAELLLQEETEKTDLEKKRTDGLISEEAYQQALLNIKTKYEDLNTKNEKDQAEAREKIAEKERQVRIDNAQKVAGVLSGLSELFGKETAAGKATAIAAATINTYLAASQALTGIKKLNPLGATIAIAQAGLIIANGIKQVREIAKVKVPGGAGGSVPSAASLSAGGSAPITPQSPQAQLTQLDQATINSLGSATNRAYVVETDITNSQERISRINRAARLN